MRKSGGVGNIADYVNNKEKRRNTPFVINPNGRFYREGTTLIPEKEFHKRYPVKHVVLKENYDKRKLWMAD